MTKDDIDKMWGQALNESIKNNEEFTRYRFAKLVAAAEREEIAKLADASVNADQYPTLTMLAQAIRMRGD
ncbi:hypothetical protein UFOVP662_18 [uncultured Caudovirales phage]|uniref:Uncharacterized protein n=1 Tax=uncultured Caudovirales phage TaxID=2100421 RepID=A0A6J5NAE4_9CAUD|nr:hypothetical protein UFOVP662_18 [uncultured Caudovirales phage]CAB4181141.1 hypothetical protein UFOVP1067_18 [uncultured Caudovirales phage]